MANKRTHSIIAAAVAVAAAAALCVGVAACGNDSSSASSDSTSSTTLTALKGVSATGQEGKEPKVTFSAPLTITGNSYAVLQKGTGAQIKNGDRLCVQQIAYDARTGTQVYNTWTKNTPDCSLTLNSSTQSAYLKIFEQQKVGATLAFGIPSETTDSTTSASNTGTAQTTNDPYLTVLTITSVAQTLKHAEGTAVTNIPSDLPKVTVKDNAAPTIDMNGYKSTGKLVVQPLIQGTGAQVTSSDTVTVRYSGWLLSNGKQFDSNWTASEPTSFSLDQVVTGWKNGLTGQRVGSRVLLIVPPDQGYGSTATNGIPANSTLVFVVDILAAY